uniref:Eukaryotic elongation factor 2 kinase n=1 Tax=Sphaerodactylus townsendi TaxID=933632 RepID=A0ACB8FKU1_9SAUR
MNSLVPLSACVFRSCRYNAVTGEWVEDEVLIKMAAQVSGELRVPLLTRIRAVGHCLGLCREGHSLPEKARLALGADMRECFRAKKLSNFLHTQNWKGAFNSLAKAIFYRGTVNREAIYAEGVMRLQMEAKLWGEEYNRHKPPKQVDIVQTCIIEMKNRSGKPLFHLEHYIEGKYIKYNSNSGFVRDDNIRLTPQAFSHFTFELIGHQLIIVDIQGVGRYLDPQIHTGERHRLWRWQPRCARDGAVLPFPFMQQNLPKHGPHAFRSLCQREGAA